ncbi:hypothetical protein [Corynebacterium sputi]|uniref:hypothetical protein n=1 Tax=Corynebacterium sputi TaxID=489915 RepID=UPI00047B345C|nr:hypothetical protein [Corynebacterium sputi]
MMIVDRTHSTRPANSVPCSIMPVRPVGRSSIDQLDVPEWVNDAPAVQGAARWEVRTPSQRPAKRPTRRPSQCPANRPSEQRPPSRTSVPVRSGGAGRGPVRHVRMTAKNCFAMAGIALTVAFAMNFAWEAPQDTALTPVTVADQAH